VSAHSLAKLDASVANELSQNRITSTGQPCRSSEIQYKHKKKNLLDLCRKTMRAKESEAIAKPPQNRQLSDNHRQRFKLFANTFRFTVIRFKELLKLFAGDSFVHVLSDPALDESFKGQVRVLHNCLLQPVQELASLFVGNSGKVIVGICQRQIGHQRKRIWSALKGFQRSLERIHVMPQIIEIAMGFSMNSRDNLALQPHGESFVQPKMFPGATRDGVAKPGVRQLVNHSAHSRAISRQQRRSELRTNLRQFDGCFQNNKSLTKVKETANEKGNQNK
jgi:hypothetical protein